MTFRIYLSLAPAELDTLPARARAVERARLDGLGFGDSPRFADPYLAAAVAAGSTRRLAIGPFVTNLVTRAPTVTAQALRTLAQLAPGRVFAGLGAGDSALAPARAHPLAAAEFADRLATLRSSEPAGCTLLVAANGPRMMAVGGALADVVVTGTGIDPATLARSAQQVSQAAAAAGRAEAMSHWCMVRMAVHDDTAAAVRELRPLLASGANHVFGVRSERSLLAPEVAAAVQRLRAGYDYGHHGVERGNPNAEAVDRLGLRATLADRFAVAGPPDLVVAGLTRLAESGIGGVVIPAVGLDVNTLVDRLGTEVLPDLRRRLAETPPAATAPPAAPPAAS